MSDLQRLLRILLAATALSGAAAAHALTFVKAPDEYLVDHADVIVRAVVRPLPSALPTDGLPSTFYSVEVVAALRGAAAGEVHQLEVAGGRDRDGAELRIYGAPSFFDGEEALLFLERMESGRLRVLQFHQGVFRLSRLGQRRAAWRSFAETREMAASPAAAERPRDLAAFERWIVARLAGGSSPGGPAADYRLGEQDQQELETAANPFTLYLYHEGLPPRWPKATAPLDLTYVAYQLPQPSIASGGFAELEAAIDAWSQQTGGLLRLRYGGVVSSTGGNVRRDGMNGVALHDYGGGYGNAPGFDCESQTGILGYGRAWMRGPHSYGGAEFETIDEGDVVITNGVTCWNYATPANFAFLLAHEIGHTLGLGHSCGDAYAGPCNTPEKERAVMRSYVDREGRGAQIGIDDRRGIAFLYGPPAAPGSLHTEMSGERRVRLVWEDGSDNESGFAIYRESSGHTERIASLPAGTTRFDDDETRPATAYRYRVRAENANGVSGAAEATITTPALDTPAQLAATATGHESIALVWVDKAGNDTAYEVWGRLLGGDELLASLPANSQAATIEGLIADSLYSFKVRAVLPTGHTAFSDPASASTLPAPIEPCTDGAATSCLGDARFKVEVRWKDFAGQRGSAQVAAAGSAASGVFYFFSPNNWEMLVKVLDGCNINQQHWVFAAGTTDVETTLIVTDSQTGKTAVYYNPLGQASPAITDTAAFEGCSGNTVIPVNAPVDSKSHPIEPDAPQPPPSFRRRPESSPGLSSGLSAKEGATGCSGTPGNLCLLRGRYEVAVAWTDFDGQSGTGKAAAAGTADSGLFYFFSPDNWEMLVKVLDGCAINQKIWVFGAATTNVAYTLTVTDTATGDVKTYENPLGQSSAAITDIQAFASCEVSAH